MQKSIPKLLTFASFVTLANLAAGLASIYLSTQHRFVFATSCIFLAALLDVLDGVIARKMKQTSEFGAQLDSLADLVSFGVAPYILLLVFYQNEWLGAIAALLPICAALRLARHNTLRPRLTDSFIGLPVDASCLLGILVICNVPAIATAILTLIMCGLFVGTYRFPRIL